MLNGNFHFLFINLLCYLVWEMMGSKTTSGWIQIFFSLKYKNKWENKVLNDNFHFLFINLLCYIVWEMMGPKPHMGGLIFFFH